MVRAIEWEGLGEGKQPRKDPVPKGVDHMTVDIQPFLDKDGLLKIWPARKRRAHQLAVLAHLAESFAPNQKYREKEVNEILKLRMTYSDFVLIRRELYEAKLLDRTVDGREYWRVPPVYEP